ncbi:hypothetical protein A2U01_0074460, partial [Trifolium medium]|nr:hypothetical protein [Trifolium medium]
MERPPLIGPYNRPRGGMPNPPLRQRNTRAFMGPSRRYRPLTPGTIPVNAGGAVEVQATGGAVIVQE